MDGHRPAGPASAPPLSRLRPILPDRPRSCPCFPWEVGRERSFRQPSGGVGWRVPGNSGSTPTVSGLTVLGLRNEEVSKPEETAESDAGDKPVQLLSLRFQVDSAAEPGPRNLRAITPRGLSDPLTFHVHAEAGHRESRPSHELASEAEPLPEWPLVVYGSLGQPAEVDYYSFSVSEGERLRFEVRSLALSDMAITLYEPAGSWFSHHRPRRLAFSDEPVSYPELTTEPVLRHRFGKAGRYLVRVSGFLGEGGPDHPYLLRITRDSEGAEGDPSGASPSGSGRDLWRERSWTRELRTDRMEALRARTASPPQPPSARERAAQGQAGPQAPPVPEAIPVIDLDGAPEEASRAKLVNLPALLVGTIEHPGDIDRVRFAAKVGDRIALEIETPRATVPVFNPYLKIMDAEGAEVLTNVHSILNANTEIEKQIRPKVIHSFPRAGEFTLEIRDITAAFGGTSMAYRVLVRPQVPHMGQIHVEEGHLNLVAGTATPLSLVTDQEEHFEGSIALSLSGLPPGVTAVAATQAEPDAPPAVNEGRKERYVFQKPEGDPGVDCSGRRPGHAGSGPGQSDGPARGGGAHGPHDSGEGSTGDGGGSGHPRRSGGLKPAFLTGSLNTSEPFAKFARKRDLLSGRVVVPGSAGVPPAQDLAGSWRLASQGWSVHPPTDAGAAP